MQEIKAILKDLMVDYIKEINNVKTRRLIVNDFKNILNVERIKYKDIVDITSDEDVDNFSIRIKMLYSEENEVIYLLTNKFIIESFIK